jgi:hypothetical protein
MAAEVTAAEAEATAAAVTGVAVTITKPAWDVGQRTVTIHPLLKLGFRAPLC